MRRNWTNNHQVQEGKAFIQIHNGIYDPGVRSNYTEDLATTVAWIANGTCSTVGVFDSDYNLTRIMTENNYRCKKIYCTVNAWDCPYYKHGECALDSPYIDCDDFNYFWYGKSGYLADEPRTAFEHLV